jgi:hypothetical protein
MIATVDSAFADNFVVAQKNGIIRGAYHNGLPASASDGAAQAKFFIANGGLFILLCILFLFSLSDVGGWTRDGSTLPGAVSFGGTIFSLFIPESILTSRVFP